MGHSLSFPLSTHTHRLKFVAIYRNGLRGNVLRHVFFSSRLRFATARQMHFLIRSVDSQRELLNLLLIHCKGKKWLCLVYPLGMTVQQESMPSAKWTNLHVFNSSQKYFLHIKSVQSSFELCTHWNWHFFYGTSILYLMAKLIAATAIEKSSDRFHISFSMLFLAIHSKRATFLTGTEYSKYFYKLQRASA